MSRRKPLTYRTFPWKIVDCLYLLEWVVRKKGWQNDEDMREKLADALNTTVDEIDDIVLGKKQLSLWQAAKVADLVETEHIWPIAIANYWKCLNEGNIKESKMWKKLYYRYSIYGLDLPDEERDWDD